MFSDLVLYWSWQVVVLSTLYFLFGRWAIPIGATGFILLKFVIPLAVQNRTHSRIRVSSLSIRSIKGLEWRSADQIHNVVPTLRIEKIELGWGGCKSDSTGLFVVRVHGISYRLNRSAKADKAPSTGSGKGRKALIWLVTVTLPLVFQYAPILGRLWGLEVGDVRVILEEMEGVEFTVRRFGIGTKVILEGHDDEPFEPPITASTCKSVHETFKRSNPFANEPDYFNRPGLNGFPAEPRSPYSNTPSPTHPPGSPPSPMSPPLSPTSGMPVSPSSFGSVLFPTIDGIAQPAIVRERYSVSRFVSARRRASVMSIRVASTANQIWTRAIGRAHGKVVLTASIHDIALILPHVNPPQPMSTKPSIPDLGPRQTASTSSNGLAHRSSARSMRAELARSVSTSYAISRLFSSTSRFAHPSDAGGFESLVAVKGESGVIFSLGFGPRKGLGGEGTLKTDLQFGNLASTLGAVEKMQSLAAGFKASSPNANATPKPTRKGFSPSDWRRIVLRAFESASISFRRAVLSHYLSVPRSSAHSSSTSLSDLESEVDSTYSLHVEVVAPRLVLSAADSSNNERARNAFGTNFNVESKVRGVGVLTSFESAHLHCTPPGEGQTKTTLVTVTTASLDGLSTWRPAGWTREELLFSSDPNLALIVARANIDTITARGDVKLYDAIFDAWKANHSSPGPPSIVVDAAEPVAARSETLPPRVRMVFDIGLIGAEITDGLAAHKPVLILDCPGFHVGCFTSFIDMIGQRRDRSAMKAEFREEEELRARRDEEMEVTDYALPPAMLKPQLRRKRMLDQASLTDDLAVSMKFDGAVSLSELKVHLSLSNEDDPAGGPRNYPVLKIGQFEGTATGDVYGRHSFSQASVKSPVIETLALDRTTMSGAIDMGIKEGIKLDLFDPVTIDVLVSMGIARQDLEALPAKASKPRDLFSRLPSGISARLSLGVISAVIAHKDPNRACSERLIRGLELHTHAVYEYAFYNNDIQALKRRHALTSPSRAKLRLPEDITAQALAYYKATQAKNGRSACAQMTLNDTFIRPIYNGMEFAAAQKAEEEDKVRAKPKGTATLHANPKVAKLPEPQIYKGWGFATKPDSSKVRAHKDQALGSVVEHEQPTNDVNSRGTTPSTSAARLHAGDENVEKKQGPKEEQTAATRLHTGTYTNALPPLEDASYHAKQPLFRVAQMEFRWLITSSSPQTPVTHHLNVSSRRIYITGDMSHVYCSLLAGLTIRRITQAWISPKPLVTMAPDSSKGRNLAITAAIPFVSVHLAFPLQDQLFLSLGDVKIKKELNLGPGMHIGHVLTYVPSPTISGQWEELMRIKIVSISTALPGRAAEFKVHSKALRLSIPCAYMMNKLILNINVSIKTVKLLLQDYHRHVFSTVLVPTPEEPKKVPNITFDIQDVVWEARDSPMESRLNLIFRVGTKAQVARQTLEDAFEIKKMAIKEEEEEAARQAREEAGLATADDEAKQRETSTARYHFDGRHSVSIEEARKRLDWHHSITWHRRINSAREEQAKRQEKMHKDLFSVVGTDSTLPILISPWQHAVPLFKVKIHGLKLSLGRPDLTFDQILEYMGAVSKTVFKADQEFSLMIPLALKLEMKAFDLTLRDYPMPLVKIRQCENSDKAAFVMATTLVIAEEMCDESSIFYVPTEVIPRKCGSAKAQPFIVQIAKTITPVKTYCRPHIKVLSERTTQFVWGASYQPGIQDFMRVIETLSHAPKDPSPRIGFWDKFRLILHWIVKIDFEGPLHLYLKGSFDPYSITDQGAGFAWAWNGHTQINIGADNDQFETIQIRSDELLIAIPDLSALADDAAIGLLVHHSDADSLNSQEDMVDLIARRFTKPCARFQNGVRVGFGFVFERACRPHTCERGCGATTNMLYRQCRFFSHKKHQEVILKSPEAIELMEAQLGRPVDSYEGFRSDYIHFSVSLVAPLGGAAASAPEKSDTHNSIHLSPKAFTHFFAWWNLFDHKTSLPVQQGAMFPNAPPPSKKFGRSLGTIKYRFDLAPVYLSHIYGRTSAESMEKGRAESLGFKARFGHFKADAHQRLQEQVVKHEKLGKENVVLHKPFYAVDVILENITLKGIAADFSEANATGICMDKLGTIDEEKVPASDLHSDDAAWYNFHDFVDADRRPFDHNPRVKVVDIATCPQIYWSRKVKAHHTRPSDTHGDLMSGGHKSWDVERTKFGVEKSHICYLGSAESVGTVQTRIAQHRVIELARQLSGPVSIDATKRTKEQETIVSDIKARLAHLDQYINEQASLEKREIDSSTFFKPHMTSESTSSDGQSAEESFESVVHIHSVRLSVSTSSRTIAHQYWLASQERKSSEHVTAHKFLVELGRNIEKRINRLTGLKGAMKGEEEEDVTLGMPAHCVPAVKLKDNLAARLNQPNPRARFKLPIRSDDPSHRDSRDPAVGLPSGCSVKPKWKVLILKPQITLRSELDPVPDSVMNLAMAEVSFKSYRIEDSSAASLSAAHILTRNNVSMRGLEALYPNAKSLFEKGQLDEKHMQMLDSYIPLEVFCGFKQETSGFEAVIQKTDAAISVDKFNPLHSSNDLEWPDVVDWDGEPINHLKNRMDQITIIVPKLAISATSTQYTALYNVVNHVLLYQDPAYATRGDELKKFIHQFDRNDQNQALFLRKIRTLQEGTRHTSRIASGYERNADQLDTDGKNELQRIRKDLLRAIQQLHIVHEVTRMNFDREDAMASLRAANQLEFKIGQAAWTMMYEDYTPLLKLDITAALVSYVNNKDGSVDSATVISDITASNIKASGVTFREILSKLRTDKAKDDPRAPITNPLVQVVWSLGLPVQGISLIRQFVFDLYPIRLMIEQKHGKDVNDYIFREERRPDDVKSISNSSIAAAASKSSTSLRPSSHHSSNLHLPSLHRTRSTLSVASIPAPERAPSRGASSSNYDGKLPIEFASAVPMSDKENMERNAKKSKSFGRITVSPTVLDLSYTPDPDKKTIIPKINHFFFDTPAFEWKDKLWTYPTIMLEVKKVLIEHAWDHKANFAKQLLLHGHAVPRPKKALEAIASRREEWLLRNSATPMIRPLSQLASSSSSNSVKVSIVPPTPLDSRAAHEFPLPSSSGSTNGTISTNGDNLSSLGKIASKLSVVSGSGSNRDTPITGAVSRTHSVPDSPGKVHMIMDPTDSIPSEEVDTDGEDSGGRSRHSGSKAKKLLGILRPKHHREDRDRDRDRNSASASVSPHGSPSMVDVTASQTSLRRQTSSSPSASKMPLSLGF